MKFYFAKFGGCHTHLLIPIYNGRGKIRFYCPPLGSNLAKFA